jgi:hypothetical protein
MGDGTTKTPRFILDHLHAVTQMLSFRKMVGHKTEAISMVSSTAITRCRQKLW